MTLYIDADVFLALLKEKDRYKIAAEKFLQQHKGKKLATSTITCLEIWFYLYKYGLGERALEAIRAVQLICDIIEISFSDLQTSTLLASQYHLSPADAVHANIALSHESIVSSDKAFDKVGGLKRIDFTES